jgi:mannitol 2-dehydrogenase
VFWRLRSAAEIILPTVRDRRAGGKSVSGLALASAFWCRYCAGATESGETIPPNDPVWDHLQPIALSAKSDPAAWLAMGDIYGELAADAAYVEAFANALTMIWRDGTSATLQAYLAGRL